MVVNMSDPTAALSALARHERVVAASERARAACTQLRWHQALRRRTPEAAAESRARGAWASAELDGARSSVDIVRDLMRGARPWSSDPDAAEEVLRGAVTVTAATEQYVAARPLEVRRTLAGLHLAAAARLLPPHDLGRPRTVDACPEFALLGPAPSAGAAAARLAAIEALPSDSTLPAVLALAIAHGEIAQARPFVRANGLVARAMDRVLLASTGLDPTGVAVIEAGHGVAGGTAYQGALQAYARGDLAGLLVWIDHCADAIVAGATEGERIADAILAGRLTS